VKFIDPDGRSGENDFIYSNITETNIKVTTYKNVLIVTNENTVKNRIIKHVYGDKLDYVFSDITIKEETNVYENGRKYVSRVITYSILDGYVESNWTDYKPNGSVFNTGNNTRIPDYIRNSWDCKTEGHLFVGISGEIIGSWVPGYDRTRPIAPCVATSCFETKPLGFGRYTPSNIDYFEILRKFLK
jgi:hypothetical protein